MSVIQIQAKWKRYPLRLPAKKAMLWLMKFGSLRLPHKISMMFGGQIGRAINVSISCWRAEKDSLFIQKLLRMESLGSGVPNFLMLFLYADMALLEQGCAIAYYGISDMYGCPGAVERMYHFQNYVTDAYGLANRTVLFGFSRGGLYSFHYAAAYPERVSVLYLDAPVLDILSWPGGKGDGAGSAQEWEDCLAVYGLTEDSAHSANCSPIHKVEEVAAANIPIIMVAGDSDEPVPIKENALILEERYRSLGGNIEMILKPGVGHHPHSLEQPEPIVSFILKHNA